MPLTKVRVGISDTSDRKRIAALFPFPTNPRGPQSDDDDVVGRFELAVTVLNGINIVKRSSFFELIFICSSRRSKIVFPSASMKSVYQSQIIHFEDADNRTRTKSTNGLKWSWSRLTIGSDIKLYYYASYAI